MKYFLILILFISVSAIGQQSDSGLRSINSSVFTSVFDQQKPDTVLGILWVSDTSTYYATGFFVDHNKLISDTLWQTFPSTVYQIKGYAVMSRWYWKQPEYLDANKQPIKLFVGLFFQINKH